MRNERSCSSFVLSLNYYYHCALCEITIKVTFRWCVRLFLQLFISIFFSPHISLTCSHACTTTTTDRRYVVIEWNKVNVLFIKPLTFERFLLLLLLGYFRAQNYVSLWWDVDLLRKSSSTMNEGEERWKMHTHQKNLIVILCNNNVELRTSWHYGFVASRSIDTSTFIEIGSLFTVSSPSSSLVMTFKLWAIISSTTCYSRFYRNLIF